MSSTDTIYSSSNIISNAMRSICIGYSLAVIINAGILMNFINKKGAILPIISAVFLMGFNIACIIIDVVKAPCSGRAVSIYVFSYGSQICLEIYQTNKMRLLAHRDLVVKILAYILFACRAISLIVLLFYYYDITSKTGLCATGYPFNALLSEKLILLFYNLGNLGLLFYLIQKGAKENGSFKFSGILQTFLFQDGLTFILAIVLDTIFICIVSFITTTWIYSMAAGLANGFNLLILHVKYCTSLKGRVTGGLQSPSPNSSTLNKATKSANADRRQSIKSSATIQAGTTKNGQNGGESSFIKAPAHIN
ncbi:hypothetical protein HDU97_002507 [Phlyctochytrium planicorne]|nr:hypothetical protein HDU97_002507 [Phlyctochytrium planicorne]